MGTLSVYALLYYYGMSLSVWEMPNSPGISIVLLFPVHISCSLNLEIGIFASSLLLILSDKRQNLAPKLLDFCFVVQECSQNQVNP